MTLRIMTANLFNGRTNPDDLARVLDEISPDLVACQELSANSADVIAGRLPHGRLEPRDDYHGGGIAAVREIDVAGVPVAGRDGWEARLDSVTWPGLGAPLTVASVHFTNPMVFPMHRSLAERRGQLADTLAYLDSSAGPLVLVGDFNATPVWPAYRRLAEQLDDGVAALGSAKRTWGPWWWFPRLLRIDHAFVRRVALSDARRVRIRGMDHSALVVDVAPVD